MFSHKALASIEHLGSHEMTRGTVPEFGKDMLREELQGRLEPLLGLQMRMLDFTPSSLWLPFILTLSAVHLGGFHTISKESSSKMFSFQYPTGSPLFSSGNTAHTLPLCAVYPTDPCLVMLAVFWYFD